MAGVETIKNHHIEEYKIYLARLERINFTIVCVYQFVSSKKIQDRLQLYFTFFKLGNS